jgi:hypothetical protein
MRKNASAATAAIAGAIVIMLTGCARSSAQPRMPAPADVVATVGSTSITLAQVDEKALQQSTGNFGAMKLAQALFEARRIAVEGLIEDELLTQDAKARKSRSPQTRKPHSGISRINRVCREPRSSRHAPPSSLTFFSSGPWLYVSSIWMV